MENNEVTSTDSLLYWATLLEDPSTNILTYYWGNMGFEVQVMTPESTKAKFEIRD